MDPNNSRHRNSADFAEQIFTYQVPDATRSKVDFIGIEYHLRILMAEDNKATQTEFYPKGIRESVKKLYDRYKLPIAILDNGYPTRDDDEKIKFLLEHLKELHDAINVDKINIFAYQWWCAIRGFTWGYGFKPFFALIDVEGEEKDVGGYEDLAGPLKRIMTRAGEYYGSICRDNGFPQSEYEKYRDMKKPLREWVEF
jgi:beta-glucosidase/6-phospho-beta-glucosidase/beta-galactosidase